MDLNSLQYHLQRGSDLMKACKYNEAIESFTKALHIKSDYNINSALGFANLFANNHAEALSAFFEYPKEIPSSNYF